MACNRQLSHFLGEENRAIEETKGIITQETFNAQCFQVQWGIVTNTSKYNLAEAFVLKIMSVVKISMKV